MNFGILKKARVVVSLVFFLLITFVFVDFTNAIAGNIIQGILYLQFLPSLINFAGLAAVAASGFIFVITLNLLFGRIYCSTICPLGTFQDIVLWFRKKLQQKKRFKHRRSYFILHYGLLLLAAVLLVFGLIGPLLLLDPYSNYGRMAANLFRPVYLWLNNQGALGLESVEIYTLYRVEPGITHWFSVSFSALFFLFIVWFSYKFGRLFCNTLCPVGAFLGLVSRFSLFKIRLDKSLCTSCGKCSAVCKAGCIDVKSRELDFSRCVGCLNCLTSCPSNGVVFSMAKRSDSPPVKEFDPARRDTIKSTLGTVATLAVLPLSGQGRRNGRNRGKDLQQGQGQGRGRHHGPREVVKDYPVSPPGSGSIEHFNNTCTACHLCVSVCPTHVLKAAFMEYGLEGIMQVRMDYHSNYCNFDCVACTEVCPTGALRPLNLDEKHVLQLGKVKFIKQNCIVYTDGTDCGACSEHCPTKAVNMKPFRKTLFLPEVNPDICIGCGACEYACPTDPKSIFVDGNPVHLTADKPEIKELEQPDPEEDFPF